MTKVDMLRFGDVSFQKKMILAPNGDIQRGNRICSQDQHADLGHISLGQQPILANMPKKVRNIVQHVRNVRNIPDVREHCSGTTQGWPGWC